MQYLFDMGTRPLAEYGTGWDYLLPDGLGSVRQLACGSGSVGPSQSYDPYGSLLSTQSSSASLFGFTGEQADAYTCRRKELGMERWCDGTGHPQREWFTYRGAQSSPRLGCPPGAGLVGEIDDEYKQEITQPISHWADGSGRSGSDGSIAILCASLATANANANGIPYHSSERFIPPRVMAER